MEYPAPNIREEQKVVVDGVTEVWRLLWMTDPKPTCAPAERTVSTCPCIGFAYGEAGDLHLVRLRDGVKIESLPLSPFFAGQFIVDGSDGAAVQRWEPDFEKDRLADSGRPDMTLAVSKRPTVQVMHFADYDHTGWADELYLQTESIPCGKSSGIVVGVSRREPRLHVLGTAANPEKPLHLKRDQWEALRDASAPIEVLDWSCGDHGSETEDRLVLRWTAQGISGTRRQYTCPPANHRLIHEEPL